VTHALIALVVAYLLGSISGSLILGRLQGVDIRTRGSGNAGGTNAFRTLGWRFALGVVAIDIGKGALAAWIGLLLHADGLPLSAQGLGFGCALLAAIGHTWPVFFGFRGGKGAGTLVGGLLLLWPWVALPLLGVWLLVLTSTGYVGLATILAALALIPADWLLAGGSDERTAFALAAALFIVFTHRANLQRLAAGNEHRFERARVLARLFGRGG
jgi:acyl phosphate:glycerol-3-phosphate acyltransferase